MNENPFDRPPIAMEKVKLEELHDMLRQRINKGYMPSATGKRTFNTKPTYLSSHTPTVLWIAAVTHNTIADFYSAEDGGEILVVLPIHDLAVAVGLKSLKTYVYQFDKLPEPWEFGTEWTADKTLALDRFELVHQLDMLG